MKEETHIFQGMRRDNHQIRQDGKFLWDAHNIRLTNRDDSTFLSITNEKGTSNELITFQGYYVGHCVLGKYLVVFTAKDDSSDNYIYRVEKVGSSYKIAILFHHEGGEWAWNPNHPIEAIGVYETELVQKVYWVDGINQPRVINIAKPELKLKDTRYWDVISSYSTWDFSGTAPNPNGDKTFNWGLAKPSTFTDQEWEDFLIDYERDFNTMYESDSFDFVRKLTLQEQVDVVKRYGQGEFSSGTIQYAISYYNKYEQESNICYVTPIYYVSPKDRGGSPEEKVSCSFDIQIWGADMNFDYIRIFSIHRTSINAVPTVKHVADVSTYREDPGDAVVYCDTGTTGETIDPTRLLYIGGRSIIPECIVQKDNTLFLGNYELQSDKHLGDIKDVMADWELDDYTIPTNHGPVKTDGTYYSYEPSLGYANGAGFKAYETYRYGIQVQYDTGEWSSPIFLGDSVLCGLYPWETYPYRDSRAIKIMGEHLGRDLRRYGVRRIRTCIVFPSPGNARIICQGIICPTVRRANSDYSYLSSWFFRPSTLFTGDNNTDVYHGAVIEFKHNTSLRTGNDRGAEIQNMTYASLNMNVPNGGGNGFVVDENVVTFHSPDLEFNPSLSSVDFSGTKLSIVGIAKLGAICGDIDIQTSSPGISKTGYYGGVSPHIGYVTGSKLPFNGGLVAGLFYHDNQVKKNSSGEYSSGDSNTYWMVYPWHRSGSLNNDENRGSGDNAGTRTAVLQRKKLSNLKFFDDNTGLGTSPLTYDISTPQLFSNTELALMKLHPAYLSKDATYMGNVDMMITGNDKYPIYQGLGFSESIVETSGTDVITKSSEPVRIKYKSSPHLVFSLGNNKENIELLPRHISLGGEQNETFTPPVWMQDDNSSSSNRIPYDGSLHVYTEAFLSSSNGANIYNVSADASLLGKYAIGKFRNTTSGATGYGLYQCRNGRRGVAWIGTSTSAQGIILKAHNTIVQPQNHYLPGTVASDYDARGKDSSILQTKTKYYRVIATPGASIQIIDITDELTENTPTEAASYKLKRQAFGESGSSVGCPYLLIGEIIRTNINNPFGEDGETGTMNMWFPAGDPVSVTSNATDIVVPFQYGDTWYGRYDCLKTYPFTQEDENQVVEIGSFMCETRVNIDGRYDRNRGQLSNLNMTPQNFNLLNEVYSQKDNFFNYRAMDKDYYKQHLFANQITWSKEKQSGEEIDTWANVTLANTLDINGDNGKISALRTWNEYLLCFQEKALSQILFNSRVQIPTTDGVPIEISNGYKVDGSRLLSGNIGCSNKWATTTTTTTGIYFLDSNTDSLYIFNGQLTNLSEDRGMDWWVRQNHTNRLWQPILYGNGTLNGMRAFYDNRYGDIYFTPGPTDAVQPEALCYSEQLGQFTSFMSYGGTQAMFNFADGFYSLRETDGNVKLYQNNVGDYNDFYGTPKGWSFSFISNQDPTFTKIFDTIDLRADHYWTYGTTGLLNSCPVSYMRADNEYQHSDTVSVDSRNMRKKFRVWRGLIPRNNGTRQRMRNPWTMITLGWEPVKPAPGTAVLVGTNDKKAVVHDVTVKYTV